MKLSSNFLKWIAIVAMFSDHIARVLYNVSALSLAGTLPMIPFIMLTIGKLTAPIMFYFIAEGYSKTRNVRKYMIRLGIFALISHIPYNIFINNVTAREKPAGDNIFAMMFSDLTFAPTSVIFTLLLAVIAMYVYDSKLESSLKLFVIFTIIMASAIGDWGMVGVVIPLIFHIFRDNSKLKWMLFFVSMWVFAGFMFIETQEWMLFLTIVIGSVMSCLLLLTYNGLRGAGGRFNKWAFYIIYPLHLLLLWGVFVYLEILQ